MRLARSFRITGISGPKQGNFLNGSPPEVQIIIHNEGYSRLYITLSANSMFRRACEAKLEGCSTMLLEALKAQYDYMVTDTVPEPYKPNYAYLCAYDNAKLKPLAETLLSGQRSRMLLLFSRQNSGWKVCLCIGSDNEIGHVLAATLGNVMPIPVRYYKRAEQGRMLKAQPLTEFTFHPLPGIDSISLPSLVVPSKYTVTQKDCIEIGEIINPSTGKPVVSAVMPISRFLGHVGIVSTTGGGKTNATIHIVEQVSDAGIKVLIFDTKRDYTHLVGKGFAVYGYGHGTLFTYNPLKVPLGAEPSSWAKTIAHSMAESISGSAFASGAFSIFIDLTDELYRERGIYSGSNDYPTLFDLLEKLEGYAQRPGMSGRQKDWLASAIKLFKSLSVGPTREAFSVREGHSIAGLLEKNVILELDGLGDQPAKNFLVSALLEGIRAYRLAGKERDKLLHVIVIEEAHNYLAKRNEASSTLTNTFREIRGLGEGIIAISQLPSEFSKDALANMNTLLVLRIMHPEDKRIICDILGIPYSDNSVVEKLPVGTCLMKTDELCMVRVPLVKKLEIPESRIIAADTPVKREEITLNFAPRTEVTNRAARLSEREWRVLKNSAESIAYNNTTLGKALGFSNTEISAIAHRLIVSGFIRYCQVKKEGVGRKQNIYFLTPYGEEAYRQKYGSYPDRARVLLVTHQNHSEMKEKVIACLGVNPEPHGRFDIYCTGPNGKEAIEIETGSNNNKQIYTNVQKSVEELGKAGFIAADDIIYYAILQQAAKYHFDSKKDFILSIALFNDFLTTKEWDTFEYHAPASVLEGR
jgi:DNA-binding MarR family transcriptional regulator